LSKYCSYISKSIQINRNKYFQFTQEKKHWMKNVFLSFYRNVFLSQYLFIPILCVKISCVNRALKRAKDINKKYIKCFFFESSVTKVNKNLCRFTLTINFWGKISRLSNLQRTQGVNFIKIHSRLFCALKMRSFFWRTNGAHPIF